MTIGTIWQERKTGKKYEVGGVNDGRVQISPVAGGDYRIMTEKSLRTNYQLVSMKKEEPVPAPESQPAPEPQPAPTPVQAEGKNGRAPAGRVQMPDGKVIAGAHFITGVCGKSRAETYKVDSPIRWLLKPAGQELLRSQGATIVYGQQITK